VRSLTNLMVTGGAGFIGSNFIRHLFSLGEFTGKIINVDKLTYAGNLENLSDVEKRWGNSRYFFEKVDICDFASIKAILLEHEVDTIVHFAAESHVDRSIFGPRDFIETNVIGTFTLLEAARAIWGERQDSLFHHVSTDEVYGSLGESGRFTESSPYSPRSPYSATKAASDHLVRAYHHTYGLAVTLSNCSNNFGPYQFPEKLVPLMILNIFEGKPLPVYGDGMNVRDWLYVEDHSSALWLILNRGRTGDTYNLGGDNEWHNIDLVNLLCEKIASMRGLPPDYYKSLVTFVNDRPGHDRRYAIDSSRLKEELGWKRKASFEASIQKTIEWYAANMQWVNRVRSGKYQEWLRTNYTDR
jgi:dTDP-glucose 4,6-dehydratase